MSQQRESTVDLKALAIFGGVAYLAMFVGMFYWLFATAPASLDENGSFQEEFQQMDEPFGTEEPPAAPEPVKKGGLGSEGSVCGGTDRLPCMPGLRCAVSTGESMGICAKMDLMDNPSVLQ